jgi:hypothetical protein
MRLSRPARSILGAVLAALAHAALLCRAAPAAGAEPTGAAASAAGAPADTPRGQGDAEATAREWLERGAADEDRLDFARALEDDRACIAAAPGSEWSARAATRIEWLRARSEGGFAPLARLERVRRDPIAAADPAAIQALQQDAESFPAGLVRTEARMVVAEAWLGRLGRPDDAIAELREIADDPSSDRLTARLAEREVVEALVTRGLVDAAAAEANARPGLLDVRFVHATSRLVVRRALRRASFGLILAFAALTATALVRSGRRGRLGGVSSELGRFASPAVALASFVALGGGLLASLYESGSAAPFVLFGILLLPLLLTARAWNAAGSTLLGARLSRALVSSSAVLAVAFLVLDAIDPSYLAGFGL